MPGFTEALPSLLAQLSPREHSCHVVPVMLPLPAPLGHGGFSCGAGRTDGGGGERRSPLSAARGAKAGLPRRRRCWAAGTFLLRCRERSFHLRKLVTTLASRWYIKKKVQRLLNLLFISVLLIPTVLIINFGAYTKRLSCLARAGAQFHFSVMVAKHSEQNRGFSI